MSRLDIFIDRMLSQRECLDFAISETCHLPGPVFELGLGNGRTFDHLREHVSGRDVFVFDREVASNPASTPAPEMMILGDVVETLPAALDRFGPTVSLVHADLGGHDLKKNDVFARKVSPLIEPLLDVGGYMVSSDRMYFEHLQEVDLPERAIPGRVFLYKRQG